MTRGRIVSATGGRGAPVRTALMGVALVAASVFAPTPALPQAGGAAAAQIMSLEEEVRRLTGRVQEMERRLEDISAEAAARINDLEYRLTELEGGDTSLVGDPVPLGESPSAAPAGQQVAVSERVALEEAEAALESDPAAARARLLQFLATYPDGPLTARAEHGLGLAQFRLGAYREAAQTFLTNVTAYPDGPKAPESLTMLGTTLAALGRTEEACLTLAEVAARHPGSPAVEQANAERARLGCL